VLASTKLVEPAAPVRNSCAGGAGGAGGGGAGGSTTGAGAATTGGGGGGAGCEQANTTANSKTGAFMPAHRTTRMSGLAWIHRCSCPVSCGFLFGSPSYPPRRACPILLALGLRRR